MNDLDREIVTATAESNVGREIGEIKIDLTGQDLMNAGKLLAEKIKNPIETHLDQKPLVLIVQGGFQTALDNNEVFKFRQKISKESKISLVMNRQLYKKIEEKKNAPSPQALRSDELKRVKISELLEASYYLGAIVQVASEKSIADFRVRIPIDCSLLVQNNELMAHYRGLAAHKWVLDILDTLLSGFTANIGTNAALPPRFAG